jgi:hypothetical protein
MRMKTVLPGTILLSSLLCYYATSQEITATISGRVTDPSGAVVPGATITVVSTDKAVRVRSLRTSGSGQYVFPLLSLLEAARAWARWYVQFHWTQRLQFSGGKRQGRSHLRSKVKRVRQVHSGLNSHGRTGWISHRFESSGGGHDANEFSGPQSRGSSYDDDYASFAQRSRVFLFLRSRSQRACWAHQLCSLS